MKVMVFVKATKESEAGRMPDEKVIAEMGRFKEELAAAAEIVKVGLPDRWAVVSAS